MPDSHRHADIGSARLRRIFLGGLFGKKPTVPVHFDALEAEAHRVMSARAVDSIAGGAGLERTIRANREAFERWQIVPRALRDVSTRDLSVELYGDVLPAPVLLAPIGVLELAHPGADVAVARAAAAEGIPLIISSQASKPMEACAEVMGDRPRWFQLYWGTSDDLAASFIRRAEAIGCRALVLTVDTRIAGWRTRDLDNAYLPFLRGQGLAQYTSDPVFLESLKQPLGGQDPPPRKLSFEAVRSLVQLLRSHPGGFWSNLRTRRPVDVVQRFIATFPNPALTWDRLAWLREQTTLPILLKGILHPDDARLAIEHGMDGIIVSNHGGRQVDGAIGALGALPDVVEAVDGRLPVLFDSGIRGGADVFKALALGARAVCVGRPYVYGLALAGTAGVQDVLRNLLADFDLTMGLAGCASIESITREMLVRVER